MISAIFISFLLANVAIADVVPTAPGPGQTFAEGGDCPFSWKLDTTGKWTSFTVDLMSGSNFDMKPVVNVFKNQDGTKGDGTYTWKCPKVSPHAPIYFYQFTQAGANTTWTTRFAISSPSGEVTPAANATQPGGAAIPWGIGSLADGTSSGTNTSTPAATPAATPATTPSGSNQSAVNPASTATNANNSTTPATSTPATTTSTPNTSTIPPTQSTPSTPRTKPSGSNSSPTTGSASNTTPSGSGANLMSTPQTAVTLFALIGMCALV